VKWTPQVLSFIFPVVANNDTLIQRVKLPAAFRVAETNAIADSITSDPTYAVSNGAAGGTDIVAARNVPASDTSETLTPTSSPALANRDLAKGDALTVTVVADSGDAATQLRVDVSGYFVDHIVADPKDD
jgi:hypothetical protein